MPLGHPLFETFLNILVERGFPMLSIMTWAGEFHILKGRPAFWNYMHFHLVTVDMRTWGQEDMTGINEDFDNSKELASSVLKMRIWKWGYGQQWQVFWKSSVSDAWCKNEETLSARAGMMQQRKQVATQEADWGLWLWALIACTEAFGKIVKFVCILNFWFLLDWFDRIRTWYKNEFTFKVNLSQPKIMIFWKSYIFLFFL